MFLQVIDRSLQGLALVMASPSWAAWCLFILNRSAKLGINSRSTIYPLKTEALEIFHRQGYLIGIDTVVQQLPCWHTDRYNDGLTDWCPKCDNTGIYREIKLIETRFQMPDGQRYRWHQPWDVAAPGIKELWLTFDNSLDVQGQDRRTLQGHILRKAAYSGRAYDPEVLLWGLWWYVRIHRTKGQKKIKAPAPYWFSWFWVKYQIRWRWNESANRLRIIFKRRSKKDQEVWDDDEIPF